MSLLYRLYSLPPIQTFSESINKPKLNQTGKFKQSNKIPIPPSHPPTPPSPRRLIVECLLRDWTVKNKEFGIRNEGSVCTISSAEAFPPPHLSAPCVPPPRPHWSTHYQ